MPNQDLRNARRNRNDEFYTQFEDIERELKHYRKHFENKVVYCNCDDPYISNFFEYFARDFENLGLKKLITTRYKNTSPIDLFGENDENRAIKLEYFGDKDGDGLPSINETKVTELRGNGDFRSEECIELLKQADIVCTNPPFSLFREYVNQLMKYNKRFLIIGHQNAISYREIFPYIKENKFWLGVSIRSGDREFGIPPHYDAYSNSLRVDKEGNRYIRVSGVRWYTNLDHDKRNEFLTLNKNYSSDNYPHYDNYDAIEVSKTRDIPQNWGGQMGVPISFLNKYNPKQFEIIKFRKGDDGKDLRLKPKDFQRLQKLGLISKKSKSLFFRMIIKNKSPKT